MVWAGRRHEANRATTTFSDKRWSFIDSSRIGSHYGRECKRGCPVTARPQVESLCFRHIAAVQEEYVISKDAMKRCSECSI